MGAGWVSAVGAAYAMNAESRGRVERRGWGQDRDQDQDPQDRDHCVVKGINVAMENAYDLDYVVMGHVNGDDDCDYDYEMKEILSGRGQPWTAVLKKMVNHVLEIKTH